MRIQYALIAFTLHFSRNRTSTLCLRISRDCHASAVALLVKTGSSTSSCISAGVAVGLNFYDCVLNLWKHVVASFLDWCTATGHSQNNSYTH